MVPPIFERYLNIKNLIYDLEKKPNDFKKYWHVSSRDLILGYAYIKDNKNDKGLELLQKHKQSVEKLYKLFIDSAYNNNKKFGEPLPDFNTYFVSLKREIDAIEKTLNSY